MTVRDALESQRQRNERRLNELHAMPGLDREMHRAEIERLKREQDEIKCQLGFDLFDEPEGLMCGIWDFDDDDDDDGFNFDDSDSEP
jgi:hypothetical protein